MKRISVLVLLLVISFGTLFASSSNNNDVPISLQTIILKKILVADQTISRRADGVILIVHDADNESQAVMIEKSLAQQGLKSERTMDVNKYNARSINAIYYATETIVRPKFITDEGILTFGFRSSSVEQGKVAIALRITENKPEVVVNKSVLDIEGHSRLLNFIPKAVIL